MIEKELNVNKCMSLESTRNCIIKMIKSPSNLVIAILTYTVWSLVGMRYSSNQNFDMVTAQQNYVMYLSLASVIVGLISYEIKHASLALIGGVTLVISFITVAASKVGVIWLGYPVGYYFLCPITIFLFLLQVKQICRFACSRYYGESAISDCAAEEISIDPSADKSKSNNAGRNKYKK